MRPHLWIEERKQVAVLWALFLVFVGLAATLELHAPPGGWFAFEFPAWNDVAPETWSASERETTLFGLGLDFLFLGVYPLFLSLLCGRAGERWPLPEWLRRTSLFFSGAVLVACPLDAVENIGLYGYLMGSDTPGVLLVTTLAATAKWAIVIPAGLVAAACLGVSWVKRLFHR